MRTLKNKIVLIATLGLVSLPVNSCVPAQQESEIAGYDNADLQKLEAKVGQVFTPNYAALTTSQGVDPKTPHLMKMAIFISYDKETRDARFDDYSYFPQGGFGLAGTEATCADYACQAFNSLVRWYTQSGFLQPLPGEATPRANDISVPGAEKAIQLEGIRAITAPAIRDVHWVITIHLGDLNDERKAAAFATAFGVAAATNNIAMLNGHFYPDDANAAATPEWGAIRDRMTSTIYEPALEAFKGAASLPENKKPYRIVAFNGCMSEQIEDRFRQKAAEAGININDPSRPSELDMITMNGYSNYRFFGPQIAQLSKNLVLGQDYKTILNGMKIEVSDEGLLNRWQSFFTRQSGFFRPMVRNSQLDALCQSSPELGVSCGQKIGAIAN